MASVALRAVTKRFAGTAAVRDVSFDIAEGEFAVILGPSGCGKTTILRTIAGFVEPDSGRVLIGGEDVTGLAPRQRNIGMVFQHYALFPNMTVAGNLAFGLRQRGADRASARKRVDELLELVQLTGRGDDPVDALSGGQQQRVALARALAVSPRVLLMDEPLSALDAQTRIVMQQELLRMWKRTSSTVVYVTHDIAEALTLAHRVIVISARPGRIKAIRDIPFGKDRDVLDVRRRADFGELEVDLWKMIAEEVGESL